MVASNDNQEKVNFDELVRSITWLNLFLITFYYYYSQEKQAMASQKVIISNVTAMEIDGEYLKGLELITNILTKYRGNAMFVTSLSNELSKTDVADIRAINEMMTQDMLKLDMMNNISLKGMRKELIKNIQGLQNILDEKLSTSRAVIDF